MARIGLSFLGFMPVRGCGEKQRERERKGMIGGVRRPTCQPRGDRETGTGIFIAGRQLLCGHVRSGVSARARP